jgi:hypothetical protein
VAEIHIDEEALSRLVQQGVRDKIEEPLNKVLAEVQDQMAGAPANAVLAELQRRVKRDVSALRDPNPAVLRQYAEQISAAGQPDA